MIDKNKSLREVFNSTLDNNGLMLKFAAGKMNILSSTLSHWRHGRFDLGAEKLKIVEEFIENYE